MELSRKAEILVAGILAVGAAGCKTSATPAAITPTQTTASSAPNPVERIKPEFEQSGPTFQHSPYGPSDNYGPSPQIQFATVKNMNYIRPWHATSDAANERAIEQTIAKIDRVAEHTTRELMRTHLTLNQETVLEIAARNLENGSYPTAQAQGNGVQYFKSSLAAQLGEIHSDAASNDASDNIKKLVDKKLIVIKGYDTAAFVAVSSLKEQESRPNSSSVKKLTQ